MEHGSLRTILSTFTAALNHEDSDAGTTGEAQSEGG